MVRGQADEVIRSYSERTNNPPGVLSGPENNRQSNTRNKVSPMGSLGGRYQSKPTARKAESPRGYGNLEKANAANRKETGNWADKGSYPTLKDG